MKKAVREEIEDHQKHDQLEHSENVHKPSQNETSKDSANRGPKEETEEYYKNNKDQQNTQDPGNKNETEEFAENIYSTIEDYLE